MLFKTLISLGIIVLVVGGGTLAAIVMTENKADPEESRIALPPPLVSAVLVEPRTVTETIVGYGSARPYRSAVLTSEVGGEIVELADGLRDGSPVQAGQLLLRIDDRRYVQALEQRIALADADRARLDQLDVEAANLSRLIEIAGREVRVRHDEERRLAALFEGGNAGKTEYDLARLAYDRLLREKVTLQNQLDLIEPQRRQLTASLHGRNADIEAARIDVHKCRIVAPFDGQIDELSVEIGETVRPGGTIASVIDPMRIEVPIEVPVSARPRVEVGAAVQLLADSMPGLRWSGAVARGSPDADEQSRTFRAYVEVDNRRQKTPLLAGYFLRAEVAGPTLEGAMLVPRGAILDDHVYVAAQSHARRRRVAIERYLGDEAVVSGELQSGDQVITTNLDMLDDGTKVRVLAEAEAASGEVSE